MHGIIYKDFVFAFGLYCILALIQLDDVCLILLRESIVLGVI